MVSADNEVGAAVVFANQGVKHALAWTGHTHGEGDEDEQRTPGPALHDFAGGRAGRRRRTLRRRGQARGGVCVELANDVFVATNANVVGDVSGLGRANDGREKQQRTL